MTSVGRWSDPVAESTKPEEEGLQLAPRLPAMIFDGRYSDSN